MTKLRCMLCCLMICTITIDARTVNDIYKRISAQVSLKVPGNQSRNYSLAFQGAVDDKGIYLLESEEKIPLIITERIERDNVKCVMVVSITALEDVYFNYQQQLKTGFRHNDCMFYLPGFWYSRNLRSPKGAPSFHISESWLVREDRLSSPLTGIFNQKDGRYMTVARKDDFQWDALATHQTGEIILSGKTSLGFTGFESHDGTSTLSFGFPYREAPKTYIRKLTLAPEVTSFQYLKKGETVLLTWEFIEGQATDYSDFICHTWEYCYDTYRPQPVKIPFSPEEIKGVLSNYFVESFVGDKALAYYSSPEMKVAACANMNVAEIGFVGRVLLNAFNAWEFGNEMNDMPAQQGDEDCTVEGYDICFDKVDFAYETSKQVLRNVSFTAKQGKVTALVGPSGGGKSTSAKLAARFWDIHGGKITLGGRDISKIDPEMLLKNYAVVFQDVLLFNASVMDNIKIGKKDATEEEVKAVARLARCDEFIARLPNGYDTLIGENGESLSGGERQRISIARALLKDAPVILLDEATASLDVENETLIQAGISELIKNKTVVIIAHRMRTVANAHHIVVLKDGTVAEQGAPDELLARNGEFARMVARQKETGI